MFTFTEATLARRCRSFRYCYFLVTAVRFLSFPVWVARGEPNPFVARNPRRSPATRQEVDAVVRDCLPEITPLA